jgi:hypothetical protein
MLPGAAALEAAEVETALRRLPRLPDDASFELALAVLLGNRTPREVDDVCRRLTCSNEQRSAIVWLVAHQRALLDPAGPTLAEMKRLMAHPRFPALRAAADAQYAELDDGDARREALTLRLAEIRPECVAPPPWVTGADLLERGVQPGPLYGAVLTELYTQQLDERLESREAALQALRTLLENAGGVAGILPDN